MDAMPDLDSTAPKIVYPCIWVFAIIGLDEAPLRVGIEPLVQGRQYTLELSKKSSSGKYRSFHLEVNVSDEADRNALYTNIKAIPGVKMVL